MLPRENRLTSAIDFRDLSRSRLRVSNDAFVATWRTSADPVIRFGFVVSKAVGSAVKRNLAKRRLRACCQSWLSENPQATGFDFVFRAKPELLTVDYQQLRTLCFGVLDSATARVQ